eukprot:IDg1376t1
MNLVLGEKELSADTETLCRSARFTRRFAIIFETAFRASVAIFERLNRDPFLIWLSNSSYLGVLSEY